MGDFKRGGNRGGFGGGDRGRFGGSRGSGFGDRGRDRGPVVMTKAICDECKKPCEVPFRPTAGKPVYCNACFSGKKDTGFGGGNDRGNGFPRKSFGGDYKTPARTDFGNDIKKVSGEEIKKQIEVLNGKIDKLTKVIEYLTGKKQEVAISDSKPVEKVQTADSVVKTKKATKKVSKKK